MTARRRIVLVAIVALAALAVAAPAARAVPAGPLALLAVQQAELVAGDGAKGDDFGASVAISGDTALVGVPYHTVDGNSGQGAVYVFTRTGGTWLQTGMLTAGDGAIDDNFGFSVALSGDTALVGVPYHDVDGKEQQGAAYVFTFSGGAWSERQELDAGDGAAYDNLGYSVAISGDTALVGAPGHTVGGNLFQGAAYLFKQTGDEWSERQELDGGSDGDFNDGCGGSVALSDDTALVGAPDRNAFQGAAYAFTRTGGTWSLEATLEASDGGSPDRFGCSVALSGHIALVGARNHTVDAKYGQGAAYVFSRSGGAWSERQELDAGDGQAKDGFGFAVALSGDTAVVGAPFHPVDDLTNWPGAAYLFTRSGGGWSEKQELDASDAGNLDFFGQAVAVSGRDVLVGAPGHTVVVGNDYQGSAYLFGLPCTLTPRLGTPLGEISPAVSVSVPFGGGFTFRFQPAAHYHVATVAVDGRVVAHRGDSYTFEDVTADHTLSVDFALDRFAITASAGEGGSISPPATTYVPYGGSVTYAVSPDPGWRIDVLLVDGVPLGPLDSYTFDDVQADHTISAGFARTSFTVRAQVSAGRGTLTPAGELSYPEGAEPLYLVAPAPGWHLEALSLDGQAVAAAGGSYRLAPLTADHLLAARFAPDAAPLLGRPRLPDGAATGEPFTLSGTRSPGAPPVSLAVYRRSGGVWRLVRRLPAEGSGPVWEASLSLTATGRYRFRASSPAAEGWLAARSPFSSTLRLR